MRIISGEFKSRLFNAPGGRRTHPMSERMRNALFNSLGDIIGLHVFDAYGGSGSLAFESISRGAAKADICELDRRARKTIEGNIESLGLEDRVLLHKANCITWAQSVKMEFDIIYADPPYGQLSYDHLDVFTRYLSENNGLLVVSHDDDFEYETDLKLIDSKSFSRGNLSFYKK